MQILTSPFKQPRYDFSKFFTTILLYMVPCLKYRGKNVLITFFKFMTTDTSMSDKEESLPWEVQPIYDSTLCRNLLHHHSLASDPFGPNKQLCGFSSFHSWASSLSLQHKAVIYNTTPYELTEILLCFSSYSSFLSFNCYNFFGVVCNRENKDEQWWPLIAFS